MLPASMSDMLNASAERVVQLAGGSRRSRHGWRAEGIRLTVSPNGDLRLTVSCTFSPIAHALWPAQGVWTGLDLVLVHVMGHDRPTMVGRARAYGYDGRARASVHPTMICMRRGSAQRVTAVPRSLAVVVVVVVVFVVAVVFVAVFAIVVVVA
ncbi:unnamed protein product, partial [Prorocentrum cordatum]